MKYKGTIVGDLSGSLGGVTATRGKSGGVLRTRVKSNQPNSSAQVNAKAGFARSSGRMRSLSGIQVSGWNYFAQNGFSPRNGTNTGQYSGSQALQSLGTSFASAVAKNKAYDVLVNSAILAGGETFEPYSGPADTAPTNGTSANLAVTGGGTVGLSLTDATMHADGLADFTIQVGNGLGTDITGFQNGNGDDVGYCIFISDGNHSENMNFSNPQRYLVGYLNHCSVTVQADVSAVTDFKMTTTDAMNIAEYKTFPPVGSYVQVSVYQVTKACQMNLVGVKVVQIIA